MKPPLVPRLWPESTVVILADGPSLNQGDVNVARAADAKIIAIKEAIRLCPDADLIYACDAKWWRHYGDAYRSLAVPKYALESAAAPWATVLRNTGILGLETDPTGLRTGRNSGYQAINLAVHLGARRIVLLGYDMHSVGGHDHWWREARPRSYFTAPIPYQAFHQCFATIVDPLAALGVEVLNATPGSALHGFPHVTLEDALAEVAA